ncbi:MAG: polysaccharide pyruvyl transferase family protein [Candidatus Hodarchaeota archaeon]
MNILITGLTLHNNKGGPALALSLIHQLKKYFENAKFFMAVSDSNDNMAIEKIWARMYGIDGIIGALRIKEAFPPFFFLPMNFQKNKKFLKFLNGIHLIVDLTALSYMDLSHLSFKNNMVKNIANYINRYYANKKKIKMIRWTQSYGPFNSPFTKFISKQDLKYQRTIFVRGEKSFQYIKELFPNKEVYSFPDIAITLPSKTEYINKIKLGKKYLTISPSSVLYKIQKEKHIFEISKLINYLLTKYKYEVILLPHNLMTTLTPSLTNCDLKVCEEINNHLKNKVKIIQDDLDVYNLKGVISKAYLHIGARYHSIVAALSAAIPCISFSWHNKYKDIMNMYEVGEYVYEGEGIDRIFEMIKNLENSYLEIKKKLIKNQKRLQSEIELNLKLFINMYNEM